MMRNKTKSICEYAQILYPFNQKLNSEFILVKSEDKERNNILLYDSKYFNKNKQLGLKLATTIRRMKEIKYFIEFADKAS